MKNQGQTAILICVVVGLVFAITFVSQWVTLPKPSTEKASNAPLSGKLLFSETEADKTLVRELSLTDGLYRATGYYDFWFKNPNDLPIVARLESMGCARCSSVELLNLSDEDLKTFRNSTTATAAQVLAAPSGLPAFLGPFMVAVQRSRAVILDPAAPWQKMEEMKNTVEIPARGQGLIRLRWEGKEAKFQTLTATFGTYIKDDLKTRAFPELKVPVLFVSPFFVRPQAETLFRPLTEGSKESVSFVCWSVSRPAFDFTVKETGNDPCIVCTQSPLSPEACRQWLARLPRDEQEANKMTSQMPIASASLVTVTVHERREGKQLDLGQFRRKIEISSSLLLEPVQVEVSGMVNGGVRLVPAELRNQIRLGDFAVDDGKSDTLTVEADLRETQLKLASKFPDFLEVNLEEAEVSPEGKKRWTLTVTVPPNRASGPLPKESEIVLQIAGTPPRGFRIPVSGHAEVRSR